MPPKIRESKVSKATKENIGVSSKTKRKGTSKVAKLPRKALADKTNSASDDNASYVQPKISANVCNQNDNLLIKQRPRRDKRVPSRYIENNGTLSLSKNKDISIENVSKLTLNNKTLVVPSPLKTPKVTLDSSLTVRRPKRICRLPSKFDNHSISPSKYVPVQPAYASTPKISNKPAKKVEKKDSKAISSKANNKEPIYNKNNDSSKTNSLNSSADTNNNAKTDKLPHRKTKNKQNITPKILVPNTKVTKKNTNRSIRILDSKKMSLKRDASTFDVYEFTYDPNEEPPPQKKRRKKPTKKREPKPKRVIFKDNYDKNLARALTSLKNTITAKSAKPNIIADNGRVLATQTCTAHPVTITVVTTDNTQPIPSDPYQTDKSHNSIKNYNSVRVEDIELDFEQDSCVDDVNYSPVHSHCGPTTPVKKNNIPALETIPNNPFNTPSAQNNVANSEKSVSNNDPLNLRDDFSFFDDQPVASSSMNVSVRNPAASPWRVEFGCLPIKWQVNTYVKPNMTPAFESSFMNFNENRKKHVYTNMVTDTNEENDQPQVYEDYATKLKQTSIISFIKEVVENNAKKKKEKFLPNKANTIFEDPKNTSVHKDAPARNHITPKKNAEIQSKDQVTPPSSEVNNISNENRDFADNSNENEKENSKGSTKSSSKKKKDKNVTYFGFDDSENHDQENVSPVKKLDKRKLRALRPRSRAVLKEINEQKGPALAALPVAVRSQTKQNSETANKLFDQMKSATEPPVFPDKDPVQTSETINITEIQNNTDSNDDQSVHLFEDIEVVHHLKAHRKSYGKAKKTVTFRRNSVSDSDVSPNDVAEHSASSDEDDLHDLTFKVPAVEPKKVTRKKKPRKPKISKKEEKEVEAWAAGFNSMCEDIEEFDLVVE